MATFAIGDSLPLTSLFISLSKADKITSMAEIEAIGKDTPGPIYEISNYTKKRSFSVKFDVVKSGRLDPIVRTEQQDFFETNNAAQKTSSNRKSPALTFAKTPKASFAEQVAKRHKTPGVGTYKISDRAYTMLSPTPGARKR